MSTTTMRSAVTSVAMLAACSLACAGRPGSVGRADAPAAAALPEPEGPEIVRIVGRHPTVIVTAGPDGPRFSARAEADGRLIVSNATLGELRATHPDVARLVDPAYARGGGAELHAHLERSRLPAEHGERLLQPKAFRPADSIDARR